MDRLRDGRPNPFARTGQPQPNAWGYPSPYPPIVITQAAAAPPPVTATAAALNARPVALPSLHAFTTAAQPAAVASPPSASPCGEVNVNGRRIPLDCAIAEKGIPSAAAPLVPRSRLRESSPTTLPDVVDPRAARENVAIRDQGDVGACTAHSLAAAIDHDLLIQGTRATVSTQLLWARYHQPNMERAHQGNRNTPLAPEEDWPWNAAETCGWRSDEKSCRCVAPACSGPPSSREIARHEGRSHGRLVGASMLELDAGSLMEVLAKRKYVWFSMRIRPDAFAKPVEKGGQHGLPDFDATRLTSAHAMVLVGYQRTAMTGTYFLLQNSWGTDWGDKGYAWIHEQTLMRNIQDAYLVSTKPEAGKADGDGDPLRQCPDGTTPDSFSRACAPRCPDGSPRHNNACGNAQGCPAGFINLFGICIVSAPTQQGKDEKTGIEYACGAGGCTYMVPHGVAGCPASRCQKACPAPKYMLSVSPQWAACTE